MPAEIDTGGHRVLHCDSRADCPTATSIHHVPTSANNECQIGRTHLSVRIDGNGSNESQRRAPKERRRKTGNCARRVAPLDYGNSPLNHGESSRTRIPRIDDEEEIILDGRNFLAKRTVALTQSSCRRRGGETGDQLLGACRASRGFPRAIEDVTKDGHCSVTWNSREDTDARDGIGRAESRLCDETERSRLAIAEANGSSIAERRSLRDRSWARPRLSSYGSKDLDTGPTDHPGRTRTAGGNPLLSSHRSHTRAKEESCGDDFKNVDEGFFGEESGNDDTWTDKNARLDRSERRDECPEDERNRRIGQDFADRKRIRRACRVCSSLQLTFLLFLVVFGRYGLFGLSNVLRVSARTNGLSVLGIGIIGAVNARSIDLIGDAGTRAERSANLSHITGASRKIQMYIKNRHLQILPDGTVNGSNDDTSDYTIFQRTSVSRGQLRIQGVATCLYLCMDSCGLLYGSREYTEDCVFNETLEQHNYNTYSSVRWSTAKKTLYLGLNRHGQPRRVQAKGHNLGRLSAYARVLTQVAPSDRVEILQRRMLGAQHNVRHRHHGHGRHRQVGGDVAQQSICLTPPPQEKDGRDRFRCRKRKKRKKRKRRCRPGERPGPQCQLPEESVMSPTANMTDVIDASSEIISASSTTPESKRSCEGAASEEACRRQALSVPAKKRKSRIDGSGRNLTLNGKNKAPTSNAKKPNVSVADSQSKKPDLTDGKKKKKRTGPAQTSRGSTMASSSRKRYGPGTTSSSRASSSLTAPVSEEQRASTAISFSSPSPPGASTALFSIRRLISPPSDNKKPPPSSKNHVTRPVNSRRVGKSFITAGTAVLPSQSRTTPTISTTSRSEIAFLPSTTKVPEDMCAYTTIPPRFSPVPSSSFLPWEESDEDSSGSLSNSSLVDEESSSIITSELATVTVESSTSAASGELIAEVTTFKLDEKSDEDGGFDITDTITRATMKFPLEKLVM